MLVSTAALFLKVVQDDHRFLYRAFVDSGLKKGRFESADNVRRNSLLGITNLAQESVADVKPLSMTARVIQAVAPKGTPVELAASIFDALSVSEKIGIVTTLVSAALAPTAIKKAIESIKDKKSEDTPHTISTGKQVQATTGQKLAVPSDSVSAAIRGAASTHGVNYSTLYAIAGAESSFNPSAGAGTSSALGLFQFTKSTWKYLTGSVYPELRYTMQDRTDPNKASIVAARYVKTIHASLSKFLGKAPTVGQVYLGYFMGPTGARRFLGEAVKDPTQLGATLFPNQAKANANLFYDSKGPLTLQGTLDKLDGRVTSYYAQAETVTPSVAPRVSQQIAVVAPVPKTQVQPPRVAVAKQATQAITQSVAKVRTKASRYAQRSETEDTPKVVPSEGGSRPPDLSYIRDKQNRVLAIPIHS